MIYNVPTGKVSGIYIIENNVDSKVYVGKSKNIRARYMQYLRGIKKQDNVHVNRYLLNAINKHGSDKFKMSLLELCDIDCLSEREHYWMNAKDSLKKGYNLRSDTNQGMVTHPMTSEKITNRLKLEWSQGLRSDHSSKMKNQWSVRDKSEQAEVMRKALTKWMYIINNGDPISYSELKEMGYTSVMSSFHRKKCDEVTFKGMTVKRRLK